jgi:UrcA family protein
MLKTLALSAAIVMVAGAAQAQVPVAIAVDNIHTEAGVARFESDVRRAARSMCAGLRGIQQSECRNAVYSEALDLLPEPTRLAVERIQQQNTRFASRGVQAG